MTALKLPKDRPVRLWVADECRLGLQPLGRRRWSLKGVRATAPSQQRYQWSYVWAALQVAGSGAEFFYSDGVSKEASYSFLRQLGGRDPGVTHVVIWDGAGFHPKDKEQAVPESVRLVTLPAYSPELNPVEKLWDILKDRLCHRHWNTLEELMEAVTARISSYWQQPQRVLSLIGEG